MEQSEYEHLYKLSDGTHLRVEMSPPGGWLFTMYDETGVAEDGGYVYDECYTLSNYEAAEQALETLGIDDDVEIC